MTETPKPKRRGRPKGSKNRPKAKAPLRRPKHTRPPQAKPQAKPQARKTQPRHSDPPVRWQDVGYTVRVGQSWPEGVPLPKAYLKRRPQPCPKCRRVLLDTGAHSVAIISTDARADGKGVAYFVCRLCNNRWQLEAI